MHGDGNETQQVFLFHVFVCIFGLDGAQHTLFENLTNQIFRLNYAQLVICEPVRSENRLCTVTVNSTSIATTLFSLLKVLKFHNQSLQWRTVCRGVRRDQPEPGSFSSTTKEEEKRDTRLIINYLIISNKVNSSFSPSPPPPPRN